jgi:hypothetical protein
VCLVSGPERSTRGTGGIKPLNAIPARIWRIWAGSGAYPPAVRGAGNFRES